MGRSRKWNWHWARSEGRVGHGHPGCSQCSLTNSLRTGKTFFIFYDEIIYKFNCTIFHSYDKLPGGRFVVAGLCCSPCEVHWGFHIPTATPCLWSNIFSCYRSYGSNFFLNEYTVGLSFISTMTLWTSVKFSTMHIYQLILMHVSASFFNSRQYIIV